MPRKRAPPKPEKSKEAKVKKVLAKRSIPVAKSRDKNSASHRTSEPSSISHRSSSKNISSSISSGATNSSNASSATTEVIYAMDIGGFHVRLDRKMYEVVTTLQQRSTNLIPKAAFQRVVKEILQSHCTGPFNHLLIQSNAIQALQIAAEEFMTQFLEGSFKCSLHAKRVTLMCKDMKLAENLGKTLRL